MSGVSKTKGIKSCTHMYISTMLGLIKLLPIVCGLTVLKPLYMYTGYEKLTERMVDGRNQISYCLNERLERRRGRRLQ